MANSIKCVDHLGNEFPSRTKMLQHYGMTDVAFSYRLNKLGWSLEKTLTTAPDPDHATAILCVDHLGNQFTSKKDMCAYWGISRAMFFRRLRDGWSQEQALSTPPQRNRKTLAVSDHLGNRFANVEEMCVYWHTNKNDYIANVRNNYTKEDALTKPVTDYVCKDHLGNKFNSINEMCRHYGIDKTKLRSRLELGWTLKEIFENPDKIVHHSSVTDHLGNTYPTLKDMLNHYGVHYTVWTHRNGKGLSLEECLTDNLHKIRITDHVGHSFDCLQDFCDYWHICTSTWHNRHDAGKSNKEIAQNIHPTKYHDFGPHLTIIKKIANTNNLYEVKFNKKSLIWSAEQICEYDYKRKHNGKSYNCNKNEIR